MRIMQIATYFGAGGGIPRHVLDLSEWLRAKGHFVLEAGSPFGSLDVSRDTFLQLALDRVSGHDNDDQIDSTVVRVGWLFRSAWKLRKEVIRNKIELIHTHETAPLLVAWLATRGLGIPIVTTYHGAAPNRLKGLARTYRWCADYVVSPSKTSLEMLISRGVDRSRARQLGLGVHKWNAPDEDRIKQIRAEFLGTSGTHLVLSLSRLDEQKALDVLIKIAANAQKIIPGLRIVVGGDGPLLETLQKLAQEEGVDDIVVFPGLLRDVECYLCASDLYVLTSRWEELPISIVEALRAGLPVIATNCGGVSELVDDTVGRLCEVDDEAALTQALCEICENDELRERLSANAFKRSSESRFCINSVNQTFEDMYFDVLGQRS